jgi:hypothetical protein
MRFSWLLPVLILIGLATGSTNAGATLLYAGGEDIDFVCSASSTCRVTTDSRAFRSVWAREAYEVPNSGGSDPATNRFATPPFSPNSTLWIHSQFCIDDNGCNSENRTNSSTQMLRVLDSSGNPTIIINGTGTAGQLVITSRTAAGAFTTLATCSNAFGISLTQLDFYINYGASGEVTLYSNSVKICDFVGNVTNGDGATTLDQVEFANPNGNAGWGVWSEVIIATTDTRAMARFTAQTVANGNATGFSGTNICSSIWNATSYNDNNYGYSGSNSVLHECTINSSFAPGVYNVVALVMTARALVGASGPLHFDFLTRVGGTDYASSDFAPLPTFSNIGNYIQTTNPATGNPWGVTDFTAAGFNVGEETKP